MITDVKAAELNAPAEWLQDFAQDIASAVERAVADRPDGQFVFVQSDGAERRASFVEVWDAACRLLAAWQRRGLAPGDRLILHLERPEQWVQALWASLLGGIVAVPLAIRPMSRRDANTFPEPVRRLLEEAPGRTSILVPDQQQAERLAAYAGRLLTLEEQAEECAPARIHRGRPEELRLLMLSSGTTGEPNLVSLSDRAVFCRWWPSSHAADGAASLLSWSPVDHVMGLSLASPALPVKVHLPIATFVDRPLTWLDVVSAHRITNATMTNFGMKLILSALAKADAAQWDLSCVRRLGVGAETIAPRVLDAFQDALAPFGLDPKAVMQGYGLTECGPVISGRGRTGAAEDDGALPALDQLTDGHAVRITDEGNRVLAWGQTGSVQVKGPSMATGYFNDAAATDTLLSPDGWIRTGDIGVLAHGGLKIVGRQKEILIINARKYACREVEEAAESIAGVAEAFAVPTDGRDDGLGLPRTGAPFAVFVVSNAANAALDDTLPAVRRAISTRFGAVPTHLLPIPAAKVPRTALGKVQRFRLASMLASGDLNRIIRESQFRQASRDRMRQIAGPSALEQKIRGVFRTVLGIDDFSGDDDFFELGGDSLAAVQLLAELERQLGWGVPPDVLHGRASVEALSRFVLSEQASAKLSADDQNSFDAIESRVRALTADWTGERPVRGGMIIGHNRAGKRLPLFWCLQEAKELYSLALSFGPEQPFYGMRSGHLSMPYSTENVGFLAGIYIREIQAIQKEGPYWIGGNCQGAVIATEIAKQLQSHGQIVLLLSLVEAVPARIFADAAYEGAVSLHVGRPTRFNPFRYFRWPELGWRKILPRGVHLQIFQANHERYCVSPEVDELTAGLNAALSWAKGGATGEPPMAPLPAWPIVEFAYRARIRVEEVGTVEPGAAFTVKVRLTNSGHAAWEPGERSGLAIGNHWLSEQGGMLVWSDGRTKLKKTIGPGQSKTVELKVRAPRKQGHYILEIDLVDEGVAWFEEKGVQSGSVAVKVNRSSVAAAPVTKPIDYGVARSFWKRVRSMMTSLAGSNGSKA